MIKTMLFLSLFLPYYLEAQDQDQDALILRLNELERSEAFYKKNYLLSAANVKKMQVQDQSYTDKISEYESEISQLEMEIITAKKKNKTAIESITLFSNSLKSNDKNLPFLKCLSDEYEKSNPSLFSTCTKAHKLKLPKDRQYLLEEWRSGLDISPAIVEIEIVKSQVSQMREVQEKHRAELKQEVSKEEFNEEQISKIKIKKDQLKFTMENKSIMDCNSETTFIDLEDKKPFEGATFQGPFYGVPRDNQNGVGTCYANGAKNFLVALSGGKDIASFLDIAVVSKKEANGSIMASPIDGGETCHALRKIKEVGFCPQSKSPIEVGESSAVNLGLLSKNVSSVNEQAHLLGLLTSYINTKSKLNTNTSSEIQKMFHSKTALIIKELKNDPDITLPLPVVRHQIPHDNILKSILLWNINKKIPDEKNKINQKDFFDDFHKSYKVFFPYFIENVQKGLDSKGIFEVWKQHMNPFLEKYKLNQEALDSIFHSFSNFHAKEDLALPDLPRKMNKSLQFLKKLYDQDHLSHEVFVSNCLDMNKSELGYLGNINNLVRHIKKLNISPDVILDSHGELIPDSDLLQIAVAPNCLNNKNRTVLNYDFHCDEGSDFAQEIKYLPQDIKLSRFREKVIYNLLQGLSVGNVSDSHINTIVGHRYNPDKKLCEVKIRESQDGTSSWHAEDKIANKLWGLTEVYKK